jgi:hypothetical protein
VPRAVLVVIAFALVAVGCTSSDTSSAPTSERAPVEEREFTPLPTLPEAEVEPAPPVVDQYEWTILSSGAGGFVTGFDSNADGSVKVARTDVGGAYRWLESESRWRPLLTFDGVDAPEQADYKVEATAIAPSDPDRIYMSVGATLNEPAGRILVSFDGGVTWASSNQRFAIHGNADHRTTGERLAVSPSDPDIVVLGTRTEGLWRSVDAGTTFTRIESVGVGTNPDGADGDPAGVTFVVFADDDTVYAGLGGVGVLRSIDRGLTWSTLIESSGLPYDAEVAVDGRVWVVVRNPGQVWRIDGADAVDVAPKDNTRFETVTVDPFDPDRVLIGGIGLGTGDLFLSEDAGDSWSGLDLTTSCPSIPWIDQYPFDFFPTGSLRFDRSDEGDIWIPEGFLVWRATIVNRTLMAVCETDGIEELVSNDVVIPPGGQPVTAHWDRALFWHGSNNPTDAVVSPASRFNSAWDLDWSPADPDFVVAVVGDQRFCCRDEDDAFASGFSVDGGRTWETFGSYDEDHPASLRFGNIAVSSSDTANIVWLPSRDGAPHYSRDGGRSWTPVELPGTESDRNDDGTYSGGSHANFFLNRRVLAADRVAPDTFYLYHRDLGLFRSVDGGARWALQPSENLPTGWTIGHFSAQLVSSPTVEGHLLFTPGLQNAGPVPAYESLDGGATWRALPGLSDVTAYAFGAPIVGDTPAVYLAGRVDGTNGVWRSVDGVQSWELVSDAPGGNYQMIRTLGASLDEPGAVYVGFSGTSFMIGRVEPTGTASE